MKYWLFIILSINIFSLDFRENSWGVSAQDILEKENIKTVLLKENLKSKTYKTFKGDYQYNYKVDEYSFTDTLESLGQFTVTYSFLNDKLIKGTYTKEFNMNIKPNKKSENIDTSINDMKNFEKAKQYLIWKYGKDYLSYGLFENYEWINDKSKIVLNYFPEWGYSIEYYANSEYMKNFIEDVENGKEFIKELNTEYKEFNIIKSKL